MSREDHELIAQYVNANGIAAVDETRTPASYTHRKYASVVTGSPKSVTSVALPLAHFHLSKSLESSALSLMTSFALPPTAGGRQPNAGPTEQPAAHVPSTGGSWVKQLVHSVLLGPEQVAQEASQSLQPVSLAAVQAIVSKVPSGQVGVQDVHVA